MVDSAIGISNSPQAIKQGLFIIIVIVTIYQVCKFVQVMGICAGMCIDE